MKSVTIYFQNGQTQMFSHAENVESFERSSCGYLLSFKMGNLRYMFTALSCAGWAIS